MPPATSVGPVQPCHTSGLTHKLVSHWRFVASVISFYYTLRLLGIQFPKIEFLQLQEVTRWVDDTPTTEVTPVTIW